MPFGYAANGRTLCIIESEAKTIRTLYDLYLELGTVRRVQGEVKLRDMRTRARTQKSGMQVGGHHFGRGHIYQILANPLYAGRIRHKNQVYDGQHPAIIDKENWDKVQANLEMQAGRNRLKLNAIEASPLIGKLFDETDDRLTPSHASKNGVRHRYYVSHRLIKQSGEKDLSGWRLPAKALEEGLAATLVEEFERPEFLTRVFPLIGASELKHVLRRIDGLVKELKETSRATVTANLISQVRISAGSMEIRLDPNVLSTKLDVPRADIFEEGLTFEKPFQLRKRGVETKLVLGGIQTELDKTLIRNIVTAQKWLEAIRQGRTLDEVANDAGLTKRRILQMMDHAFLAPDIVKQIAGGRQPVWLTSEWLQRNTLPLDWEDQRQLIASL
ncbi:MAG: recombinase family protein [Rhodobacteraceae bacterium]|nr:recombinase family protein [Paracoccaceae bacterium]